MSFKAVTMCNNLISVTNLDRRKTISVDFHKKKINTCLNELDDCDFDSSGHILSKSYQTDGAK